MKDQCFDIPKFGDRYTEILNVATMERGETYSVVDVSYSTRDSVVFISFRGDKGTLLSAPIDLFMRELGERKYIREASK